MTVDAQHFQTRCVTVGFRAVPLVTGKPTNCYSSVRIKASPDNTVSVYIGPGPNVATAGELVGFPLAPGEHIDSEISSPALWAIADDIDQQLNWAGL